MQANLMRFSFAASLFVLAAIWFLWLTDLHPHFNLAPSAQSGVANWDQTGPASTSEPLTGTSNSTDTIPSPTKKPSDRPLILYAFFETELSRRNFEFFLKHALHDGADFLFLLNGDTNAENIIPKRPNIRYIKRKNECYDMGAFAQVLVKDNFYKKYNKFITMNSSIRGPFFPLWSTQCWTDAYLAKLTDKVKLVGMTLACLPHVHVQSMIWATDLIGMETLLFPSPELIEKFKNDLPPHDNSNPVPPWQTPGINFCPDGYWNAVAVEVFATPLIRSAGYEIDVMMTAYHSMPEYEKTCGGWLNGDVLGPGHYYGMDIHPFDTIFQKTNRGSDAVTLEKMTVWTEERKYSSYDFCGK